MKKYFFGLLLSVFMFLWCVPASANEIDNEEWYEMELGEDDLIIEEGITNPYNLYLSGVNTFITYAGNYDVRLRAEVYCTETVATIETIFYLQKSYSGVWKTVSEGTATKTNSNYMYKNMYVYDVTEGTYRCKTHTKVTSSSGYTETMTGYSPDVDVN